MKPFAEKFYNSPAWKKCRNTFFNSKHGLCERCGNSGLIVHHKTALTPKNINDTSITLSWSNLELLCSKCHQRETFGSGPTQEGLEFDEDGNLVYTPRV